MIGRQHRGLVQAAALVWVVVGLIAPTPLFAQSDRKQDDPIDEAVPPPKPLGNTGRGADASSQGQAAASAVGRAGERQNRAGFVGITPTARLQTRLANRVQTRLRNRIDRNYDSQANAISPFKVAGEGVKRSGQGTPR